MDKRNKFKIRGDGLEYNPFNKTAIIRKGLSKPTKILKDKNLLIGNILNFGCGHNEDSILLQEDRYNIVGYDKYNNTYNDENLLNKKYDTVICNYVLNVISDLEEHEKVLQQLKKLSDNIYICVRSDSKAIKDSWVYSVGELGYWTSRGSFQRFYDKEDIKNLIGDVEYISDNSAFKLVKLHI